MPTRMDVTSRPTRCSAYPTAMTNHSFIVGPLKLENCIDFLDSNELRSKRTLLFVSDANFATLYDHLTAENFPIVSVHDDKAPESSNYTIIITTNLPGSGDIDTVVNYDMPTNHGEYQSRLIGRPKMVVSFASTPEDINAATGIYNSLDPSVVRDWIE